MVPPRGREAPVDETAPAFRGGALKRSTPPKSLYKGLAWDRQEQCWRVRISFNGKQRHVGRFADEVEAAQAFDCGALLLFGPDAATNFGGVAARANLPRFLGNSNMGAIEALSRKRGRDSGSGSTSPRPAKAPRAPRASRPRTKRPRASGQRKKAAAAAAPAPTAAAGPGSGAGGEAGGAAAAVTWAPPAGFALATRPPSGANDATRAAAAALLLSACPYPGSPRTSESGSFGNSTAGAAAGLPRSVSCASTLTGLAGTPPPALPLAAPSPLSLPEPARALFCTPASAAATAGVWLSTFPAAAAAAAAPIDVAAMAAAAGLPYLPMPAPAAAPAMLPCLSPVLGLSVSHAGPAPPPPLFAGCVAAPAAPLDVCAFGFAGAAAPAPLLGPARPLQLQPQPRPEPVSLLPAPCAAEAAAEAAPPPPLLPADEDESFALHCGWSFWGDDAAADAGCDAWDPCQELLLC
ncbi:hypothetical protein Rsub_11905 [Raphidocelis subcapitata]|uniref:AP2/ERF domain-containing protein n=1 Tax=Raphidocelis subcapitata TaxID=307507 RepID=A0A2V0PH52_9CHLO|nr:hypothetical protein Rsub_11905 [Raphidocelis subcapitata]|eukprot:GBF99096.1 hypothetical protein Rsub_11905 [Raphidocelis subcapitata]